MTAMYPSTGSRFNHASTSTAYPECSRVARPVVCQRTHPPTKKNQVSGDGARVGVRDRRIALSIGEIGTASSTSARSSSPIPDRSCAAWAEQEQPEGGTQPTTARHEGRSRALDDRSYRDQHDHTTFIGLALARELGILAEDLLTDAER